ncbi:hypothetical protein VNI00_015041 [Paramarasmius palmivorus]|uniref:SMP-30/Gluconolactonase/LRE-like region domain-containing protein n=1 Tax=Paramarasmius palmivorus TaxID=297713 RepID=A0AAW0BPD6_9AGAR
MLSQIHILPNVTRFNADPSQARVLKVSDSISVALFLEDKEGHYFGAGPSGVVSINEETGEIRVLKELLPASLKEQVRFNDGAVDCKGRFWFGELDFACLGGQSTDSYIPKGRLWRYDPDGTASIHDNEIAGSNGIAWSPDNKFMYHNDSIRCTVRRYEFDPEAGTLSNRIDFIDLRSAGEDTPDTAKRLPDYLRDGHPDGMVTDTEGNLWIAIWKKSCEYQLFRRNIEP